MTEYFSQNFEQKSDHNEDEKSYSTKRHSLLFKLVMDQQQAPPHWIKKKLERYHSDKEAGLAVEEILPVRLRDIGMKGRIQILSEVGKYVVHVGQTHTSSDLVTDYLSPHITASQKAIEKLIVQGKISEIFIEAQFEGNDLQDASLARFRNMELTRNFATMFPSLMSFLASITEYGGSNIDQFVIKKKIDAFLQKCIEEGWEEEKIKAEVMLKTLSYGDLIIDPYKELGAAGILRAEGTLKTHPAEDKEAHAEGITSVRRVKQLRKEILEEYISDQESKKIFELQEDLRIAEEACQLLNDSERESVAIRKIVESPYFAQNKLAYLIYGAAHDFYTAVNKYNQQNPDKKLGLIYITNTNNFVKYGAKKKIA